jgi:hypothetical protein
MWQPYADDSSNLGTRTVELGPLLQMAQAAHDAGEALFCRCDDQAVG